MGMGASCGYWKEKVSDRNKKKYNIEETNDHTEENIELNNVKNVKKIYQEAMEIVNKKRLKVLDMSYVKMRKNHKQNVQEKYHKVIVPYQFSEKQLLELHQLMNIIEASEPWQKIENDDGQIYYYNGNTHESVWEVPDEFNSNNSENNSSSPKITSLSIANHNFKDKMPNTIGKFCTIQPSKIFNLVELDLSKNKLGEKTMSTISNCLIISSTTSSSTATILCQLEKLKLSDNSIGDKGLSILANKLKETKNALPSSLKSLYLDRNGLSNISIIKFAEAFSTSSKIFSSLTILSLSGNRLISNDGVISIVNNNLLHILSELFLSGTKVSDDGAIAIAKGLIHDKCSLVTLSISGANVGDKGGFEIAENLPLYKLRGFDLQGNSFSKEVRDKILANGKRNKSCYVVVQDDRGKAKVSKR